MSATIQFGKETIKIDLTGNNKRKGIQRFSTSATILKFANINGTKKLDEKKDAGLFEALKALAKLAGKKDTIDDDDFKAINNMKTQETENNCNADEVKPHWHNCNNDIADDSSCLTKVCYHDDKRLENFVIIG